MKRELAFALEARSKIDCSIGRTRSSRSDADRSVSDRSNDVSVNRRNKRVKTAVNGGDSVKFDVSGGDDVSPAAGDEKSAAAVAEAVTADERTVAEGEKAVAVVEKENVKGDKRKKRVESGTPIGTPKRFTRSALKEEEEELGGTPTRKKLELKMSKKIGLGKMPTNLKELLETGLLDGFRVYYKADAEGKKLQGLIKGAGILCSCKACEGNKVISPSQFEVHAINKYAHAIKHIFLENGKSLLDVIEICKTSAMETQEVALQTVISSLPVKGPLLCTNCNSSIKPTTENLLICDSCMNQKQGQAGSSVATCEEVRPSSPDPQAKENSLPVTPDKKSKLGRKRKSSKPTVKSPSSAKKNKLSENKIQEKILKRSPRAASAPKTTSLQKSGVKLTIKNQGLHWSVFQKGGLPDGTELTYVSHGQKLLHGYKSGHGIFCFCCNTEISASLFEAHAGWASRKKPYENIYISNGVSLHEYAVSLKKSENRKCPASSNDDLCRVCWDGGDLLLCDGCPRSFHQECADLPSIPHGKWYCRFCQQSMKLLSDSKNALAAGRVEGVDPIQQIMTRCIRIAKTPVNNDLVACYLCRCHDFSKNVFNDRTVIVCDQCEKEYHIGCLREHSMADLQALPKGNWFCSKDCERIHSVLKDLVTLEPKIIPDDILALVREKQKDGELDVVANSEMRFVLLSGKNATRETRKMLAQTVDIFHECFDPIVDATTGRDFIPSMVYGRKIWSQDFAGMLCAILTIDSNVVSVGTLRVFGEDIAELPIVATSKCNQGKGYFQLLFTCIERLLSSMKIKKLVLPAAEEAKSIWTNKFGFESIEPPQLEDLKQTCAAMMTFKGTSMLQKEIPEAQNGVADTAGEDNGNINLSVPEAQTIVVDTAEDNNINPSVPEVQNGVADTVGEDNSNINLSVSEAQNGVADTAENDNGKINLSIPEAQNGVADTAGEDNGNINLSVPEAQTIVVVVDTAEDNNINPSVPEVQNGVADTVGEDNSNINLSVSEAQNGVADTAENDNGKINLSIRAAQNVSADTAGEDNGNINPSVPEAQNSVDNGNINLSVPDVQNGVSDTSGEDNGNINPSDPEAQNGVADTSGEDNGNINLSVPDVQNGVSDTAGEDNGNITSLVSETQKGVADTAGEDIGNINSLVPETQNGVADTTGEDIGNINHLVE